MKKPRRTGRGAARVSRKKFTHSSPTPTRQSRQPPPELRLRRLAAELHSFGERPLFEFLLELSRGADPWERLEAYARLAPLREFIVANGGDKLPPLRIIEGGAR